jgi:DNA-binding response OmpR family regulator
MQLKILIADDEKMFQKLISDILIKEGYKVLAVSDGEEAIDAFFSNQGFDLVILDVMMPHMDGWQACQAIREESDVPIIMLTALGDVENEVKGLNSGADDYITKPFSYEIFKARVRAALRKNIKEQNEGYHFKDIHLYEINMEAFIDEKAIELSKKEYELLKYLVINQNRALSRDQILNAVWGYDYFGGVRTVDTHIKLLRAKLDSKKSCIKTVRGIGYKLV